MRSAKKGDSEMWQLSRQKISRQIIGRQFRSQRKNSSLKKKQVQVRLEPRTFAPQGYSLPPGLMARESYET